MHTSLTAARGARKPVPLPHCPQTMNPDSALDALLAHYRSMPPVAAMDVAIEAYDGTCLRLRAPLDRNVNDKGCAFGGSLGSLMTLAGWGLVTLQVTAAGLDADVFVASSQVDYLAPLFDDLRAGARLEGDADWGGFLEALRERGRASAMLVAEVPLPGGGVASRCRSRYVAIARR